MTDLVPVVDLHAPDAAHRLDEACREVGFLSVVGHDVPAAVAERMLTATDALFALPLATKLRWRTPSPDINRGYAAKGTEHLAYSLGETQVPPDLFEAFNIGPETVPEGIPAAGPFAPNLWPEDPALSDLQPALVDYFEQVRRLAHRLTGLCAQALGLDADFFERYTGRSTDTLRVNHFERAPGEPDPGEGQQRMGAHTDYGIVTVLYADRVPGLQVLGPDDAWHGVLPPPGAFLVNLGDLLAQWTNDRWRSTLHRVVPPPRSTAGPAVRRSVAFFHDGDADALVECLPTCTSPDNPPRYPPVLAGEHLLAKLVGPRSGQASEAVSTLGDRRA